MFRKIKEINEQLKRQKSFDEYTSDEQVNVFLSAVRSGNLEQVQKYIGKFIKKNCIDKINAHDQHGKTALIWAACNGHTEIVRALLTVNVIDVNAKDNSSETALIQAVRMGYTDIVLALLRVNGIDVNSRNNCNETALMEGARYRYAGHAEIVRALLAVNGIDVNARGYMGKTALDWANDDKHYEVARIIQNHIDTHPSPANQSTFTTEKITYCKSILFKKPQLQSSISQTANASKCEASRYEQQRK